MHIEVYTDGVVWIRIMSFRYKDENSTEFRITNESSYAGDDIVKEELVGFACYDDFAANESRSGGWKIAVNNCIESNMVTVR